VTCVWGAEALLAEIETFLYDYESLRSSSERYWKPSDRTQLLRAAMSLTNFEPTGKLFGLAEGDLVNNQLYISHRHLYRFIDPRKSNAEQSAMSGTQVLSLDWCLARKVPVGAWLTTAVRAVDGLYRHTVRSLRHVHKQNSAWRIWHADEAIMTISPAVLHVNTCSYDEGSAPCVNLANLPHVEHYRAMCLAFSVRQWEHEK